MNDAAKNPPTPSPSLPKASGSVPLSTKLAYGLGGVTNLFGVTTVKSLAVPFFQMTLHVNPALLGLAMAIPRIWDAITDPLMGHISDQTKSKYGRRRPYIVLGALLSGLAYLAIWFVPVEWASEGKAAWYLAFSLIFFTCFTIWQVPYNALGYEVTPHYDERTRVMGWTSIIQQITQFAAPWIFPLAGWAIFASVVQGMRVIGIVIGIVFIAGVGMIPGLFVKERYQKLAATNAPKAKHNMLSTFRIVFKNRNMRLLMGTQLAGAIASIFASGLDYYVIVYYMFDGDVTTGSTWKAILSTGFAICGFISVPLLVKLSERFDKRNTLIGVYLLSIVGALSSWFVFNPLYHWLLIINPILVTHVYTAGLLKQSMVADICDEDELKTGKRHEGAYGALFAWVHKMSMSLSFLAAGIVLNLVGFDSELGGEQPERALTSIRLILVVVPSLSSAVSIFLLSKYQLDRNVSSQIREQLELRRGAL